MPSLSFANNFKLNLPLVTDCYVFNAAGFTENRVIRLNSLCYQVLYATTSSFFFHNAGNQNFTLKTRLLIGSKCGHNHSGKGALRIHGTPSEYFSFFNPKRQMSRYRI